MFSGDFEKRKPEKWSPGERAPVKKPEDNLHPEGDFEIPDKEEWRPAERPKPKKPTDNLRPEGDFERPEKPKYAPAERPVAKRPSDNLRPEGEFTGTRTITEDFRVVRGERAEITRHVDNITIGGEFIGMCLSILLSLQFST